MCYIVTIVTIVTILTIVTVTVTYLGPGPPVHHPPHDRSLRCNDWTQVDSREFSFKDNFYLHLLSSLFDTAAMNAAQHWGVSMA